jgi:dTDP-4-dehydrorhamnose reductase
MTTTIGQGGPPIILLGADGMLGRAMRELLVSRGASPETPSRTDCDLSAPGSIRRLAVPEGAVVINCAAWTDVDGAEQHEAEATAVNGDAVGVLAERCAEVGAALVTYGTDYVFDGNASGPYKPAAKRSPIGAYGRSKAAGEELLEKSGASWLNIRTSWLYAPWGTNFVRTFAKLLKEKKELKVVNDQRGRPTSAEHLARTTLELIERETRKHWHVTDGGACTWYEFALEIKKLTKAKAEVLPCTTAEFPRPAQRPAYSILDISQTERQLGPMPNWRENLADVVGRLETK